MSLLHYDEFNKLRGSELDEHDIVKMIESLLVQISKTRAKTENEWQGNVCLTLDRQLDDDMLERVKVIVREVGYEIIIRYQKGITSFKVFRGIL